MGILFSLKDTRRFINKEKFYFYLLVAVIFFNIISNLSPKVTEKYEENNSELTEKEEILKKNIAGNPEYLIKMSAVTGVVLVIIFFGVLIDLTWLIRTDFKKIKNIFSKKFDINWTFWDACKIVILFLFFGYCIAIIEGGISYYFPILRFEANLRILINSSIHEAMVIFLVLYFSSTKGKFSPRSLGIEFKDFFKNLKFSIIRYIGSTPFLVIALLIAISLGRAINYQPKPQDVLKFFLKEDNRFVLFYMTALTIFVGPVVEELFFRGFLYPAIKRNLGSLGAVLATSFLFAFLHANFAAFLPIMVLGVLLTYVYEKTGSIISSIAVHIVHNGAMLFFVFFLKSMIG